MVQWERPRQEEELLGYYVECCVAGSNRWEPCNHKPISYNRCPPPTPPPCREPRFWAGHSALGRPLQMPAHRGLVLGGTEWERVWRTWGCTGSCLIEPTMVPGRGGEWSAPGTPHTGLWLRDGNHASPGHSKAWVETRLSGSLHSACGTPGTQPRPHPTVVGEWVTRNKDPAWGGAPRTQPVSLWE